MNSATRMVVGMRALRATRPRSRGLSRVGDVDPAASAPIAAGDDMLSTSAVTSSQSLTASGRAALLAAWPGVTGETPNLAELQIAGAVAAFESGYGTAHFNNQGVSVPGQNNWGSVMCSNTPPCDGVTCFEATDHGSNFVTAANPTGAFQACFKIFATPALGAAYFVRQITTARPNSWAAMKAGDIDAFSLHMFNEHYYGGLPVTAAPAVRIANHAATVAKGVQAIATALGEPVAATRGGAPGSGLDVGDVAIGAVIAGTVAYAVRRFVGRV
jgi:hypothetical protein